MSKPIITSRLYIKNGGCLVGLCRRYHCSRLCYGSKLISAVPVPGVLVPGVLGIWRVPLWGWTSSHWPVIWGKFCVGAWNQCSGGGGGGGGGKGGSFLLAVVVWIFLPFTHDTGDDTDGHDDHADHHNEDNEDNGGGVDAVFLSWCWCALEFTVITVVWARTHAHHGPV